MACTTCLPFELPECPEAITINTSLDADTDYYLHFDNFGIARIVKVTTDSTGKITLNVKDNPEIPPAYFNQYNGFYEVRITKDKILCNSLAFELCDGSSSDCLLLTFKKYAGEQPEAVIPCNCPE